MLTLRAEGLSRKEIAHRLYITDGTVKNHLRAAYEKLGAQDAIDAFRALGWLRIPNGT